MAKLAPILILIAASACISSAISFSARIMEKSGILLSNSDKMDTIVAKVSESIIKTDMEWQKILTPEQYHILRQKGTEAPFSGQYFNNHEPGIYICAACGNELFSSDQKFDSGTGWPSFWAPLASDRVEEHKDSSSWMTRTEVACSRCGGHLGHEFDDGPLPTGLRYCINSQALKFIPENSK